MLNRAPFQPGQLPLLLAILASPAASMAQPDTSNAAVDTVEIRITQVFSLTQDDLDNGTTSLDVSGLLQSSRDVFTNMAGYNLGQARFRIRGLDGENSIVSINGIFMNDLETGWAPFSQWGGLNDVTRWMEIRTGVSASPYGFGGIGGWSNIDTRASGIRKGLRASYAISDRSYRNRLMATYATGMTKKGWALAMSASHRWAEEGYVEGTFFYATSYFLSAEKKLNDKHSIGFTGFGVNLQQGRQGLAVQEIYDLTGTHYYNPNWGLQDGQKRNARVSHDHKPVLMLTHYFTPDSATTWATSLYYSFGRDGLSNLNWYDARDPRPDYYRYLPSYYTDTDPANAADLTNAWMNDVNTSQINWDQLYFANRKNLYTMHDVDGIAGNDRTGNRSKYVVEELRNDPSRLGINSVITRTLDARNTVTLGLTAQSQRTENYRSMQDLLGGDFWVDVDQFAEQDFVDNSQAQSDLNSPNNVIEEGDRFGFDYDITIRTANVFGQLEHKGRKWDTYAGITLGTTSFWRTGNFRNGLFPTNSYGDSEKQAFVNFGVKAGALYKISGRHYVGVNAAYLTRPPVVRAAYLSPRTRDEVVNGLTDETVYSGDVNYHIRAPKVKLRATAFYAAIKDQVWARSFYHDEFRTFINYTMTGVDNVHTGVELGAEVRPTATIILSGAFTTGQYLYDSRPIARITRDNSNVLLAEDRLVFLKNYRIGGMPQTAASGAVRYNHPKFWSVGANVNWFSDMYLDPNPDRRTADALENLVTDDPQWADLLDQTRLEDGMTIDAFIMKSWLFQRKYRLAVNFSVTNLLNEQDIITGGFEQLRYDRMNVDAFPAKYSYMYGRTFYAMLTFSF